MTISFSATVVPDADVRNALENALRAALNRWRFVSGHTLQYWLRGYCLCFAKTLLKFMGEPASLGSILANDGAVHHVIAMLGDLAIDARGVNTKASLLAKINLRAEAQNDPLRAADIIRFESEHALLLKRCPESEARKLRTCLDTPAMRDVRRQIKIVSPSYGRCTSGCDSCRAQRDANWRKRPGRLSTAKQKEYRSAGGVT